MGTAADDRVFESDVALSPEETQDTLKYFEAKGQTVEVDTPVDEKPPEQPAKDEVAEPPKEAAAVADKPGDSATPPPEEHPDLDPEERAEWQSADTDGKKLGSYAKKNKAIRELKTGLSERDAKLAEKDRELAELKGRLAERQVAAAPVGSPLEPVKPAAEVKQPEPPKAKEFAKVAPVPPDYNNFLDEPDINAAHTAAVAKYADQLFDWKMEKRDFEAGERQRIEQEAQQQTQRATSVTQKLDNARAAHADFDTMTNRPGVNYTGLLGGVLMEVLDDGGELAYQLAKPEHAEVLKKINAYTDPKLIADPVVAQKAMQRAIRDLGVFADRLTQPAAVAPPEQAAPPIPVPVVVPPAVNGNGHHPPETVPPSNGQPRREEAAPAPIKGKNATPASRIEDISLEDYDARRAYRIQHGIV